MSIENVKKLELGVDIAYRCDKFINPDDLSKNVILMMVEVGRNLIEDAMRSGDICVLRRVFDYFLEEPNDEALENGGGEILENAVFNFFLIEQILLILQSTLDMLIKENLSRAMHFVEGCINSGYFKQISKIFEQIPTKSKVDFWTRFSKIYFEYYPKEIKEMIDSFKGEKNLK